LCDSADLPALPASPLVVFDDDHYYLGAVLAERYCAAGLTVTLVTPAERVSAWTVNTLEQPRIQRRLLELGVNVVENRNVVEFDAAGVRLECVYTGRESRLAAASLLTVTSRLPDDALARALADVPAAALSLAGIVSVSAIGDCFVPDSIAAAVYAGHRHAREFDWPESDAVPFRRE
jgi:dimethylamine/trimethylamine dehydrogenase